MVFLFIFYINPILFNYINIPMALDKAKLINLLAHNLPQTQVAAALGLTDGRISQLVEHPQIAELVELRKQELATQEIDKITTLDQVSDTLLEQMGTLAGASDSLGEVVRAYETVEKIQATKRAGTRNTGDEGVGHIVCQIPIFIQQNLNIVVNKVNEITTIEDKSMASMPTAKVHNLIKEHQQQTKAQASAQAQIIEDHPIQAHIEELEEEVDIPLPPEIANHDHTTAHNTSQITGAAKTES